MNSAPSACRLALLPVRLRPLPDDVTLELRSRCDRSDALTRGDGRARGGPAAMSCRDDVRRSSEPQKPLLTAKSAARIISGVMAEAMAVFNTFRWRFTDHCTGSTCSERGKQVIRLIGAAAPSQRPSLPHVVIALTGRTCVGLGR